MTPQFQSSCRWWHRIGSHVPRCEILVLSGFRKIEVIDLDTIDVSNLNRQFLFRSENVGQPEAVVAAEAVKKFNPHIEIVAHYGNVKDPKFGVSYVERFQVVLNALDNVDARKHVNRLCLGSGVPLIDSGTTGYLGQVMPIIKGRTQCYECTEKPTQKVYPICTIRSTPDKPVHCIVWAKECFKLLFGNAQDSMLYEDPSVSEESTYMHLTAFPTDVSPNSIVNFGKNLLTAMFDTEIVKKIEMDTYKTAKKVPEPIAAEDIEAGVQIAFQLLTGVSEIVAPSKVAGWDNKVWSKPECVTEIILCLHAASQSNECEDNLLGKWSFDKDDLNAMKFVCAASNLRSHIFGIDPKQCFHDAKGVAGNIIPAIATTSAIVAVIQVAQAFKLLSDTDSFCPHTYCSRKPNVRGIFLQPTKSELPEEKCFVCSKSPLTLHIDITTATFGDLISKLIKARLGFNAPSVTTGSGDCLYEEGDGADTDPCRIIYA